MPNNYYLLTSEGELYHYGVPGMKWGRRKKVAAVSKAREKSKHMSRGIRDDYDELKKELHLSDKEIEKRALYDYGDDWRNKQYLKAMGEPSTIKEYREQHETAVRKALKGLKAETDAIDKIVERFENVPMDKITKKDYKQAKRFVSKAYYGGGMLSTEYHANSMLNDYT